MATKIKGIDISTWQGTPDFSKVKASESMSTVVSFLQDKRQKPPERAVGTRDERLAQCSALGRAATRTGGQ